MLTFSLSVQAYAPRVRVMASASPECWGSLHARLIIAGFVRTGDITFIANCQFAVFEAPAGLDVDDVMRRLFIGFKGDA